MKNTIRSSKELLNTNNDLQILVDKKFENMDQQFSGLSLFFVPKETVRSSETISGLTKQSFDGSGVFITFVQTEDGR